MYASSSLDTRARRLAFVPAGCALICRCTDIVPHRAMLVVVVVSGRGCLFGGQGSLQVAGVSRRCTGIVVSRQATLVECKFRHAVSDAYEGERCCCGVIVRTNTSCAFVQAGAAIIRRCADIVRRRVMLVVTSRCMGIRERRG